MVASLSSKLSDGLLTRHVGEAELVFVDSLLIVWPALDDGLLLAALTSDAGLVRGSPL